MFSSSILFMLAASWFYLAFMLARADWRWFAGRIAECVIMGVIPAICFAQEWSSPDVLVGLGAAFVLFAIYPTFMERRILNGVMAGAAPSHDRLAALQLLSWDHTARTLHALAITARRVTEGWPERRDEATAELVSLFAGRSGSRTRSRYVTPLMLLLFRAHRWTAARDIFERVFADLDYRASPELLLLMVRPCAELGQTARAFDFIKSTADHSFVSEYEDERVLSCVALLALAGRREELVTLIERHHAMIEKMPPAFVAYWRGIANLAAGDEMHAREKLEYALNIARRSKFPNEREAWEQAITLRLQEGPAIHGRAVAAPLTDEQAAQLLAIDDRAHREVESRPAGATVLGRGIGPVTVALIAVNALIFLGMYAAGVREYNTGIITFGANVPLLIHYEHQYWRLISSMFIHVNLPHLAFNMYALYLFGTFLERWCRSRQLFLVYMAAGIIGSVASVLHGNYPASAGASGAIMGLLGASIAVMYRYRRMMPSSWRSYYLTNFVLMAALTMLFGIMQKGIDNYAHGGGLLSGAIIGFFLPAAGATSAASMTWLRLRSWALNGLIVVCIAMLGYTGWKAAGNVIAGGYPAIIPHLAERIDPRDQLALAAPPFWQEEEGPDQAFVLKDPLSDSVMQVRSWPAESEEELALAAEKVSAHMPPGVSTTRLSRFELGGRVVYNFRYGVTVRNEETRNSARATADVYLTSIRTGPHVRICRIEFQTLSEDYKAFLPMIRQSIKSIHALPPTRN